MAITSLTIENLRGIERLSLEGLAPLTFLTGPNGCGKSTVLDAVLLGACRAPSLALEVAVSRRRALRDPAAWLVRSGATDPFAQLRVTRDDGRERLCQVHYREASAAQDHYAVLSPALPLRELSWSEKLDDDWSLHDYATVDQEGVVHGHRPQSQWDPNRAWPGVHLIDPSDADPLADLFAEAVKRGREEQLEALVRELIPPATGLRPLPGADREWSLYVKFPWGAIPVAVAGDGVQALLQQAATLAGLDGDIALIEEPETFLHPGAMSTSARVIAAAVQAGKQVILSTHSLEMIDALLEAADEFGLTDRLAAFRMWKNDAGVHAQRVAGADVRDARFSFESDLR